MYFYSETHESLMRMPLQTFWLLSNNIERIQAQLDLRTVNILLRTGMNATSETVDQTYEALVAETGEIVKISAMAQAYAPRDEAGVEALKLMTM
jgi:hypothetical protein